MAKVAAKLGYCGTCEQITKWGETLARKNSFTLLVARCTGCRRTLTQP